MDDPPYFHALAVFACKANRLRSEEHTSELQSHSDLVCRLLLEKKKNQSNRKARTLVVGNSSKDCKASVDDRQAWSARAPAHGDYSSMQGRRRPHRSSSPARTTN